MPKPLTTLERDVLDWLIEYVRLHTYQPSIREIGAQFEIKSTKTVSELLQSLASKGWIERSASRSRGVRLLGLDLEADVVSVPFIDVHLADSAIADPLDNLTLDRRIAGTSASFLVSMVGDDMRGEGIRDGDLLLVEPVALGELIDGDLVLCRLADQPSVRRFTRVDGESRLEPGRLDRPPTRLHGPRDDRVLGRIGAVIRRLRTDAPMGRAVAEPSDEGVAAR